MTDPKPPVVDERAARSNRAKALLEDPVLSQILRSVMERATQEWMRSSADQPDVRESAWHRVRAVQTVMTEIESVARDSSVRDFNTKAKK
jgi:hypothetical protein